MHGKGLPSDSRRESGRRPGTSTREPAQTKGQSSLQDVRMCSRSNLDAIGVTPQPTRLPTVAYRGLIGLAVVLILCAGCGNGGNDPSADAAALPTLNFWLHASAATKVDGITVECGLDFIVEIAGEVSRTSNVVEYVGTMGGEARRYILNPDESGTGFSADAFSEVQVLLLVPDRVQINMINVPPDPPGVSSRFWDELRHFEGWLVGDQINGEWTCAPIDTEYNGVNDNTIFAPGNWFSEAING